MSSVDYQSLYNTYWQRPDRFGSSSFADATAMARRVMKVAGAGSVLDVGCGFGALVHALLREGIDARGVDIAPVAIDHANATSPGRFQVGSILALPFPDGAFDTVVCTDCLEHLAESDVQVALRELARVARKNVFIVVSTVQDRDHQWHLTVRDRDWWELQAFTAGEGTDHLLRRHPRSLLDVSYEAREHEGPSVTLALEKCPIAMREWPRGRLLKDRGLHMDMLREPGRRADAHLARYVHAASVVRPGDSVLDASCGLGYGSHLLRQCTSGASVLGVDIDPQAVAYAQAAYGKSARFEVADATNLSRVADHSIDLVACFETLEHVSEPEKMLREFVRVLTPGGRLLVSVPHDWTDESGHDPNPHHLQVYDWARLRSQLLVAGGADAAKPAPSLDNTLWIEQLHRQVAGGGMKHASAARVIAPLAVNEQDELVEPDLAKSQPTEWLLATAIKSPLAPNSACSPATYRETIFTDASGSVPAGNLASFKRDYENPWLLRSMIALGMRITRPTLLRELARRVMQYAPENSPDFGGALCVLLYDALTTPQATALESELLGRVSTLDTQMSRNPHVLRWRVSNWFAAGLLHQRRGDLAAARVAFDRCTAYDVLAFSPLLATKTIEARFRLGCMIAGEDLAGAKRHWHAGVLEAQRVLQADWVNLWGDDQAPLPFALPEASQVIDLAARCAAALRAGEAWRSSPAHALAMTTHTPAQQSRSLASEHAALQRAWADQRHQLSQLRDADADLRAALERVTQSRDAWAGEAKRLEGEWKQLAARIERLSAAESRAKDDAQAIADLRTRLVDAERRCAEADASVERLYDEAQQLLRDRDRWLAEAKRLEGEWNASQTTIAKHQSLLAETRSELSARTKSLDDAVARLRSLEQSLASLTSQVQSLHQRRAFRALQSLSLLTPISIEPKPNGNQATH
jgi:ubiquinone/menaquinone biosynthesis C-methylase UbiE/predicted  nucleic acid-binding Zn-ribbon protein